MKAYVKNLSQICPILPFINDTEENIIGILNYCMEAKVYGIICFGMGMTLREGSREYFYKQLAFLLIFLSLVKIIKFSGLLLTVLLLYGL